MNIIFASQPAYGHLYPLLPLAAACAEAGHEVTIAAGDPFMDQLPLPTVYGMTPGTTLHEMEQEVFTNHPELRDPTHGDPLGFPKAMFGESCPRRATPVLLELFDRMRPDLVIYEVTNVGAALAADLHGVRAIAFGLGLWNPFLSSLYEVALADQAERWGGRTPGALASLPGGYLDVVPPSMQNPGPLPASRLPIRSVPWAPPGPLPAWLEAPATRPRAYLTLGTVAYGAVEVLRRAVLETAAHDVDVLVAVGPEGDPALLGDLPANVHTERFVPQAQVLAKVDVAIHHGGAGTTLAAVANGLPQLILPQGADQP